MNYKETEELKEKLKNPYYLPSYDEVFNLLIELNKGFGPDWVRYCTPEEKSERIYEFLNESFITKLADYLSARVDALFTGDPVVIVETNAGNGRLTGFVFDKMKTKRPFRMIATDDLSWEIQPAFPVQKLSHQEAMWEYSPNIVISSWMPYGSDFTAAYREAGVDEYILIGESDGGCCGAVWETWGYPYDEDERDTIPPYARDCYHRVDHKEISEAQLCRTDYPDHNYHSSTVSFIKESSMK